MHTAGTSQPLPAVGNDRGPPAAKRHVKAAMNDTGSFSNPCRMNENARRARRYCRARLAWSQRDSATSSHYGLVPPSLTTDEMLSVVTRLVTFVP